MTFQEEDFESWLRDSRQFWVEHFEELSMNKELTKKPVLAEEKYRAAEKEGYLHIASIRDYGKMVGYFLSALLPHLHYEDLLCASTDVYWVKPEYRTTCGVLFMEFIEQCWKKRGVKKAYVSCKIHADRTKFFEGIGYTKSDFMFVKVL